MPSVLATVLIYTLLPFLTALLTLLLFPPLRPIRPHLRPFTLSLFPLPLLDLLARLWPLQPFVPLLLLLLLLSLLSTLSLSLLLHLSSHAFANLVEFISAFFRALNLAPFFALLRPFDDLHLPTSLTPALDRLQSVLHDAQSALNYSQLEHCANLNSLPSTHPAFLLSNPKHLKSLIRSLTLCPPVLQSLPPVNAAAADLLTSLNLTHFFNSTTLPARFRPGLDDLSAALHDIGHHLNLTQLLVDNDPSPPFLASLARIPTALTKLHRAANFTAIFASAAAKPAAQEALLTMRSVAGNPANALPILFPPEQFRSPAAVARGFVAAMPMSVRLVLLALAGAIAALPLLFVARAGVVEMLKTALTLRYERHTPPAQRNVSGWLRAGAVCALGVAVAEVLPFCALFGALAAVGLGAGFKLAVHALAVVPVHVVTQLRVAEAMARRDVLKSGSVKVRRAFAFATLLHATVGMWWNWGAAAVVAFDVPAIVVVDVVPVAGVVWWGRRICRRTLADERRMIEERERKDE